MEGSKISSVKIVGFWVSPYVHRVRWALKLKGVDYEYIEEDIFNRSSLLSELNPVYGEVPVLIHDGKPLPESSIILEYIDEIWNYNPPLLPQDPYERAQTRFWAQFAEEKVGGSLRVALCSEGEKQESAVKSTIEALEKLEEILKGKKFFGGVEIGYLDLVLGFVAYLFPVLEEFGPAEKIIDPLKFPAFAAWKDNLLNHPVIKAEYLPSKAEIIPYFQWLRKKFIPT